MNSEHTPSSIDKLAPTTGRSAEMLASKHGFDNLAKLAESLPHQAHVLDIGAGASSLGREVTWLRSDINWTNFDYSYSNPTILNEVQADSPPNLNFVAGDVTALSETFAPESMDAVFSYWLLPHLSIDSRNPAMQAARQIYRVAKPDAMISIGPKADKGLVPINPQLNAEKTIKKNSINEDQFAKKIVSATKVSPMMRYTLKMVNEVITPTLGTSRYTNKDGVFGSIYDAKTDSYVSPFSLRGTKTFGKLAIAAARYIVKKH